MLFSCLRVRDLWKRVARVTGCHLLPGFRTAGQLLAGLQKRHGI